MFLLMTVQENIYFFFSFNSCSALNPDNHTWASVFQSLVASSNFVDHIIFKHSPFKTSCSAVDLGKKQDVIVTAEFQGDPEFLVLLFLF